MASDMVSMIEPSGARCVAGFESANCGSVKSMLKLPPPAALPWPSWPSTASSAMAQCTIPSGKVASLRWKRSVRPLRTSTPVTSAPASTAAWSKTRSLASAESDRMKLSKLTSMYGGRPLTGPASAGVDDTTCGAGGVPVAPVTCSRYSPTVCWL